MSIALLPPLTRSGPWNSGYLHEEALTEGPAFARTRAMSRWHRVRSAVRFSVDGEHSHTSYHLWCGQHTSDTHAIAADEPLDGEPVCGTCEGRAEGYNPQRPDLLFTPDDLAPPRWCPSRSLYETVGPNVGRCRACGQFAPVRVYGWNGVPKIVKHEPLDLVAGCPFHAWRYLVVCGGAVLCQCLVRSEAGVR